MSTIAAKQSFLTQVKESDMGSKGKMNNSHQDLKVIASLGVQFKHRKPPDIKVCYWGLPMDGVIKVNTDRASRGNPGRA
ncbi:hypothetical protein GIB67_013746 [Kingdonia uniflora]|uniref:Uncharacterized protein n=1 Tax=Kingdonia uniflora TaxID=39325 RepID=A0A7J7NQ59_9MAGN|nr:hypothetical protein GIB67_013746 [Kingdonia uniflora]